jgi:Fibronectin type III domain
MAQKADSYERRPASRRNLLESLENRQLMAFTGQFNFQPSWAAAPGGYTIDSGKSYSWQNGLQYGWNSDNSTNMVDRHSWADDRYDTFAYVGRSGGASTWEVAVPNGSYSVKVTAGDAIAVDSHYGINVEGQRLINETPTWSNKWAEGAGTVWVNDGKLTVTGASGAWNNKITSIAITPASGAAPDASGSAWVIPNKPSWSAGWAVGNNAATLNWGDASKNEHGFIVERSTDGWNFSEAGRVGTNVSSFTDWSLKAGTNYVFRVKAYNAAGASPVSPNVNVKTGVSTWTAPTAPATPSVWAPAAPGWISASSLSTSSVGIGWGDVANETGYIIQRSTDGSNFSEAARVGANNTWYVDNGLKSSTKYFYRIQSYNNGGTSTSSTANASTGATWVQPVTNAPSAPTWMGAQANGQNAANLQWGDVANETGYIIERSTDGWTFAEAGRVNANVTSYASTGLSAGTKYVFRVKAFNSGGTSSASMVQTITTAAPPVWTPPPATGGNNGGSTTITNKFAMSGISANGSGTNANVYKATLDDVGIKNVRIWYSFTNWNDNGYNAWYTQRAVSYKQAGYTVMLAVLNPNPTDYNTAKAFYNRIAGNATLRNVVDYWQVGNEPNIPEFWYGNASQYVNNMLKPAYEALKSVGETVVGAGPSWDVNYARTLTSLGYTNYIDYSAFHPYGDNAQMVIERAAGAKAAFNNKPLMVTEWNIVGQYNNNNWVSEMNKAALGLQHIAHINYYFAMVNSYTHVGTAGLLNMNGTRNTPFYDAVKGWLR